MTPPVLTLELAAAEQLDPLWAIYAACVADLLARGVRQWDAFYPNRQLLEAGLARRDLFVLRLGDGLAGGVILNDIEAEQYAGVAWHEPGPAWVVHALALDPRAQGRGWGRAAMAACEAEGRRRGFRCARLDAYPGNAAAVTLYERLGYQRRGTVEFDYKPPGHQTYVAYEKAL